MIDKRQHEHRGAPWRGERRRARRPLGSTSPERVRPPVDPRIMKLTQEANVTPACGDN